MSKVARKYWKPIIFALSLIIFIAISRLLLKNQISSFDDFIFSFISQFRCEPLTYFFRFVSFLCSTWFLILATVLIMTFSKNRKNALYIGLNVLLCFLLNQSFKLLFARERPIDINLIVENGYSFPSGHSMVSLAFYGFFIYIIIHKRMKRKKKILYCSLLALLTLLIGISRIYLGVHYVSDVIAGFCFSIAYLIIFCGITKKYIKKGE